MLGCSSKLKMPAIPPVLVVAIVVSIFTAAVSPCAAGQPPTVVADAGTAKPLVENLPTSPAALDFIRTRCNEVSFGYPDRFKSCYDLLLPYATSINGSYNRATTAGVTAMVSKLTFFARDLQGAGTTSLPQVGGCIQVVNKIISGAKEPLAKLNRLDAMGDNKVDANNPDLDNVTDWMMGENHNFASKCRDVGGSYNMTQDYVSAAYSIAVYPRAYWNVSLPSPDGSGP